MPATALLAATEPAPCHRVHQHLFPGMMTRRGFMSVAAGATGALLTSGLWWPAVAEASEGAGRSPRPIPGGIEQGGTTFHVFLPGSGSEPSTITDFKGLVGLANVGGTGTGTDLKTGETADLVFDADMRFMRGTFIATDGRRHHGTFGFV